MARKISRRGCCSGLYRNGQLEERIANERGVAVGGMSGQMNGNSELVMEEIVRKTRRSKVQENRDYFLKQDI